SSYYAGSEPFPDNTIALDISEFAPYINEYDLFLRTDTSSSSDNGVLNNFAVEFYSDYDEEAFKIISGETGGFSSNMQTDFLAPTANSLSAEEHNSVIPLDRASPDQMGFIEEYPGVEELAHDMDIIGVYEEGKNYNIIVDSKYGTGDIPPTIEQWKTMVKLRAVDNKRKFGILPNEVDHSETQYFPPVGNQGREGSCVAFTFGYYIQTYTEAREHNWDLSGTSGGGDWPGYPLSNLDKIISPDFLYHQINGGSPGANGTVAASFINRMGGSSWQEMPYSDDEESGESPYFYNWPSESAYREAAQYRGRETNPTYWSYNTSGYFVITSDAEITLLKELLAAGYCVYVSVEAAALYNLFDSNDVVTGYSSGAMSTNHANTIVGYKEGSAWDLDNPDD
ncbi:MAG: hypothetical protein KAQ69_13325, partial [Spirochaetales bacterium]|nr:hypothetical protein [Spirochaetales bacterium]